jgi:hypothetical protein
MPAVERPEFHCTGRQTRLLVARFPATGGRPAGTGRGELRHGLAGLGTPEDLRSDARRRPYRLVLVRCTGADAIAAVQVAIGEAERVAGGISWLEQVNDKTTGQVRRIKLDTDNGEAFKGRAFTAFIASRPELLHIHTRRKSPGQNGVRERAFGSLKYEQL